MTDIIQPQVGVMGLAAQAAMRQQEFAAQTKQMMEDRKAQKKGWQGTTEEMYLIGKIKEAEKVSQQTLQAYEPIWSRDILYVSGMQYLTPNMTMKRWDKKRHDEWVPQPVINLIQPKVQRIVDFFTRNPAGYRVTPNSREQDDIEAARYADDCVGYLNAVNREKEKQDLAAHWNVICGNVFKRHIASTAIQHSNHVQGQISREPQVDPATGLPMMGPPNDTYTETPATESGGQNEIVTEISGPFNYCVPLAVSDFDDAPWNLYRGLYPINLLRQMYPDKADFIGERGAVVTSELYTSRLMSLVMSGPNGTMLVDPYVMEGFGLLSVLESGPQVEFPSGLCLISLDNILLYAGELPLRTR